MITRLKESTSRLSRIGYLPVVALAQIQEHPKGILDRPEKIVNLANTIRDWIFTVFMIAAVAGIIYTAFMYLTAAGDTEKLKKARTALTWSIVAVGIGILAGSIPVLLENLLIESAGS